MRLLPKQQKVLDIIERNIDNVNIFVVRGAAGSGKTLLLEELAQKLSAKTLTIRELLEEAMEMHPLKWEEALYSLLLRFYKKENIALIDDIDMIYQLNLHEGSQRYGVSKAVFKAIKKSLIHGNKKLICTTTDILPDELVNFACVVKIPQMEPGDLEILLRYNIDITKQIDLDVEKVIKYAPGLSSHQIMTLARIFNKQPTIDTQSVLRAIDELFLSSISPMRKPDVINAQSLIGLDSQIEIIKNSIIAPIESFLQISDKSRNIQKEPENNEPADGNNDAEAMQSAEAEALAKYRFKKSPPALRKGAVLFGPEGSGKTALGKFIAGLLPNRFLFINGCSCGSCEKLIKKFNDVFALAKKLAPSVIFIDDMEIYLDPKSSLYSREVANYIKSAMDGLTNVFTLPVCVILTATNILNIPGFLLRSGRFDLHIELKLPDEKLRLQIFKKAFLAEQIELDEVTAAHLSEEAETFCYSDCIRLAQEVSEEIKRKSPDADTDIADIIYKKYVSIKSLRQ